MRIHELAEQAREHARRYVDECKHYGYYMEHNEFDVQFERKFAELIVLDVHEINKETCRENKAEATDLPGYKTLMNLYYSVFRNKLSAHFGIDLGATV